MDPSLQILIVQNNIRQSADNAIQLPEDAFNQHIVNTKQGFIAALSEAAPDVILFRQSFQQLTVPEALHIIQSESPGTPVLLLANNISVEETVEMINFGISDIVTTDKIATLSAKIKRAAKRATEKKEKRLERLQQHTIYNTVQEAIFMLKVEDDGRMQFISANSSFLKLSGLEEDAVLDRYADDVFAHSKLVISVEKLRAVVKSKQPDEWEEDFDHNTRTGHIQVHPICDNRGACTHLVGSLHEITKLKMLMSSVEESNQRYRYVTRATSDGIWDWNITNDTISLGDGFVHLFGKISAHQQIHSADILQRLHPSELTAFRKKMIRMLRSKQNAWKFQHRFLRSNGEFAEVANRALIIRNPDGRAIRMIGAMQDISEKKVLEQTLNDAISISRFGSWELDTVQHTLYWSPMIHEVLEAPPGYEPSLETGLLFYKEGASRDLVTQKVADAIEKGKSFDIETEMLTPAGNQKWIRVLGKPHFENGICVKVNGSMQDITTRKSAEITAKQVLEERNTILESIADAFFAVDQNWTVAYWNKRAEEIFGKKREEIVGKHLWEVFPHRVGSRVYHGYLDAIRTNTIARFEDYNPFLKKWFSINCYPSGSGGLTCYLKDVTDRKQAELRLQELNEHLQQQATELSGSNKKLEESEQRFSKIFNLSPQPMWLEDAGTGKFMQVNNAAIQLYGYSEQEFLAMRIKDIEVQKSTESTVPDNNNTSQQIGYKETCFHRIKNGDILEMEIYGASIVINSRPLRSVIAIDVTERNQQDQKLMRAIIKTQEDERNEIGSELHDNICQILAGSQIVLGCLQQSVSEQGMPLLEQSLEYTRMASREIRNLSHRLAPVFLENSTLEEAIQKLADTFSADQKTQIKVHFDPHLNVQAINPDIQLNIYRILQEQLRNVIKHANATEASIELRYDQNMLHVKVADNGRGFDTTLVRKGIGLTNIRRRAELFSGRFELESSPGKGCVMNVYIPI